MKSSERFKHRQARTASAKIGSKGLRRWRSKVPAPPAPDKLARKLIDKFKSGK